MSLQLNDIIFINQINGSEGSVTHLFFQCLFFADIWYYVLNWMSISMSLCNNGINHLHPFEGLISCGRAFIERVRMTWFACIWCILRSRNEKLFKDGDINMITMLEFVKWGSWNWLKIKSSSIVDNFSFWYSNPRDVLGCLD